MLIYPAHRVTASHGKAEQAAVEAQTLLPEPTTEHLHRRGLRQRLPRRQGALG